MKATVLSALALTFATTANAHGYILNWVIDGTSHKGYDPTWDVPENRGSPTRPSDNSDTGEFMVWM